MVFVAAFVSFVLYVTAAAGAAPRRSGLAARIAHYEGRHSTQNQRISTASSSSVDGPIHEYSINWAGAIINRDVDTFSTVSGSFVVPTVKLPPVVNATRTYAASAWVGIDGDTCNGGIVQAGLDFTVNATGTNYIAWTEWFIDPPTYYEDFVVRPGDEIKVTITAHTRFTGNAVIENVTTGERIDEDLSTDWELCRKDAEWIVEELGGRTGSLANFGSVTFTEAVATARSGDSLGLSDLSKLSDIKQNETISTSTTITPDSIVVQYIRQA